MPASRITMRRVRFFVLERLLLPIAAAPLRAWVRSWTLDADARRAMEAVVAQPRVVVATLHGMLFHLLAFAAPLRARGRTPVVLVSPSLDGRLLAKLLVHFGVEAVAGTVGQRGVSGARAFVRAVAGGAVGIVAVDGPRGPRGVVRPGVLQLGETADAEVMAFATESARGIRFASWDRAHLPLPRAVVRAAARRLRRPSVPAEAEAALVELGRTLESGAPGTAA